jgi:hypothetical protein
MGPQPEACVDVLRQREDISAIYGNTDVMIDGPPLLSDDTDEEKRRRRQHINNVAEWTRESLSVSSRAWLRELPFHLRFSPTVNPRDDLFVVHANPVDVNQIIFPPEDQQKDLYGKVRQSDEELARLLDDLITGVLAFGHLHVPSVRKSNDIVLVNVSSVSIPGDGDARAKYALFEWDGNRWHVEHRRVDFDVDAEIAAFGSAQPPGWQEAAAAYESLGMIPQKV